MKSCLVAVIKLWVFAMLAESGMVWAGERPKLNNDGLHDPANPALHLLQEASDTIAALPEALAGTGVNWNEALEDGLINPRASLRSGAKIKMLNIKMLNQDIIMPKTAQAPWVLFPHRQHTDWIDCESCHDELFASKAGATPVKNMFTILNGESCGLCHGAVAFPLTECRRCHSVPRYAR